MAGGPAIRHSWALESLKGGMKGSDVIASEGTDVIRAKDGDEDIEFALV
jgi:hypothetical protein